MSISIVWYGNNRVGVNTRSPAYTLHVDGTFGADSIVLADLTASRLTATDGSKQLASVANLASWIAGTASQIAVANDGDGTITLSLTGNMDEIAALTPTDSNVIVGNGTTWVAESGATARTSLGLGSGDSPTFAGVVVADAGTVGVTAGPAFRFSAADGIGMFGGAGKFGINTNNPSKNFTIYRTAAAGHCELNMITDTGEGGFSLYDGTLGAPYTHLADRFSVYGGSTALGVDIRADSASGTVCFYAGGFAAADKKAIITATRGMGVGTDTPGTLNSVDLGGTNIHITGATAVRHVLESAQPETMFWETDAAANQHGIFQWMSGGVYRIERLTDAFGLGTVSLAVGVNSYIGIGGITAPNEWLEVGGKIRANTAFNLNGTDGASQAAAAGTVCDVTTLAGGIATAQTQITYATNGTYNFDATSGKVSSITITNGRITGITTAA